MDDESAAFSVTDSEIAPPPLMSRISSGYGVPPPALRVRQSQTPTIQLKLNEVPFRGRSRVLNEIKGLYETAMFGNSSSDLSKEAPATTPTKGVFIHGDSGCGKTAIMKKLKSDLTGYCACFIETRCDESKSQFSAFLSAIAQLSDQLIQQQRQHEIELLQQNLEEDELMILQDNFDTDHRFQQILRHDQTTNFASSRSMNSKTALKADEKFYTKMQKILRVYIHTIASPTFPVIWCFDDLHQMDQDTSFILHSLLQEQEYQPGFFFLGCYRSDLKAVRILDPFLSLVTIKQIEVFGMNQLDVIDMIAGVTNVSSVECEKLGSVIWKKTGELLALECVYNISGQSTLFVCLWGVHRTIV